MAPVPRGRERPDVVGPGGRQFQVGDFGTKQVVRLFPGSRLDIKSFSTLSETVTLQDFGGQFENNTLKPGGVIHADGRTFTRAKIQALDAAVLYALVPENAQPTWEEEGSQPAGQTAGNLLDGNDVAPVSVAAATGETVAAGGSVAIPQGTLIRFCLSCSMPGLTTAADLTYIALKGHISGKYYAVAMAGNSVAGTIRFQPSAAEVIDVVYRNQDTVAHTFAGSWSASEGE